MTRHLSTDDFQALLEGRAADDVRAHVQECALCREIWQDVGAAHAMLSQAEMVAAPASFHAQVMDALGTEETLTRPLLSPGARWGLAGLVLASGLAAGIVFVMGIVAVMTGALGPLFPGKIVLTLLEPIVRLLVDLGEVLVLVLKALVVSPWAGTLLLLAVVMTALTVLMTRFYSRRLYLAD